MSRKRDKPKLRYLGEQENELLEDIDEEKRGYLKMLIAYDILALAKKRNKCQNGHKTKPHEVRTRGVSSLFTVEHPLG